MSGRAWGAIVGAALSAATLSACTGSFIVVDTQIERTRVQLEKAMDCYRAHDARFGQTQIDDDGRRYAEFRDADVWSCLQFRIGIAAVHGGSGNGLLVECLSNEAAASVAEEGDTTHSSRCEATD